MKKTKLSLMIIAMMATVPAFASGDPERMHADKSQPMEHEMHGNMSSGMQHEKGMAHEHGSMQMDKPSHEMEAMKGTFLVKKDIDGYTVSFHVMKAPEGMAHGGTFHLMVKIEKGGKVISDAVINSKSLHPNGESESKMMMKMGDWYMAGYDLGHEGQHQLMVLFKTSDGVKHFGGVFYPEK